MPTETLLDVLLVLVSRPGHKLSIEHTPTGEVCAELTWFGGWNRVRCVQPTADLALRMVAIRYARAGVPGQWADSAREAREWAAEESSERQCPRVSA